MTNTKSNPASTKPKPYKGMAMEGFIAGWYAKNARRDHEFRSLANRVSEVLPAGSRVLEVAPGPGFLSIELAGRGYRVVGLDISKTFVEIAQANAKQAGVAADFRLGNASDMPFEAESFDFIVCTAAFKNFTEPVQAIIEMYRVLKSGSTALIVDLRRDADPAGIQAEVKSMNLNRFNAFVTQWTFDHFLLKNAYTPDQIRALVAQTDFKKCRIQAEGIGMEIWLEK